MAEAKSRRETGIGRNRARGKPDFSAYIFGVLPGCDLSVSTVPGGGTFAPDAAFDIVPNGVTPDGLVPEPASLSMLLFGLGGLPFLRRRFAR